MKNLILLLACVLLLAPPSHAQEREESGFVRTHTGFLIVCNMPGNYFTIEIRGKTLMPYQRQLLFLVDDKFVQISFVDKQAFLSGTTPDHLDDKTVLGLHRDWEGKDIGRNRRIKPKIESEWLKLSDGKDALAWSYYIPGGAARDVNNTRKHFYLSVIKGEMVLQVNVNVTGQDTDADEEIRQFLMDAMNTLKTRDSPLSLEKASEMVKRGLGN